MGEVVLVRVSPEIIEQAAGEGLEPAVVVGFTRMKDGTYDMTLRSVHWIRERDQYREALEYIRDHGNTHGQPCWALHQGDCAEVMQEAAKAALGA